MMLEGESERIGRETEHGDKEPTPRHGIIIETKYTETESDRSVWLDRVFGTGFSAHLDGSPNHINASAFAAVLEDWKVELPVKHHVVIDELRGSLNVETSSGKALPQVITESLRDGDWNRIDAIQEMSVSVLRRYGSQGGRQGWDSLGSVFQSPPPGAGGRYSPPAVVELGAVLGVHGNSLPKFTYLCIRTHSP